MQYMLGTSQIPRWSMAWYDLNVRDRRRDAVRYLVYRAVEPHQSDWEWVALPGWLSFLYPLLRPPRLVLNEIRRLSKMIGEDDQS